MKKKNRKNNKAGIITVGGNFTLPGQKRPNVIVLTQPKRFGLDISDYMAAVKAAEKALNEKGADFDYGSAAARLAEAAAQLRTVQQIRKKFGG